MAVWIFYAAAIMYTIWSSNASRVNQQGVEPGTLSVTTVDASSPVPVLFGTRVLSGANCVWWGDVGTTAIKSKGGGKK